MSALPLALLIVTAAAVAVGVVALRVAHALRGEIAALRSELAAYGRPVARLAVPAARTDTDAIRAAVADALAEERERELAEARAFWAAQEARDASDAPSLLGGMAGFGEELFGPRAGEAAGVEIVFGEPGEAPFAYDHDLADPDPVSGSEAREREFPADSPELAAARRRHPSHPDFVPSQPSPIGDHDLTIARLEQLAADRTELADVRPGPLGTLDVYVFEDGTTLCTTPGHRETAELLAEAVREGRAPCLLGGSGVSGAFALTFGCGEENVYLLADRVIASV
ncbi:hypothetical protein AB0J21_06000 [Streptomyces sp. NPDC049954]|uniref:hypothetical protein n=1 Tax=Streptomyces sp. NPDC049954 TaxID=3155779 RepID=UPI00343DDE76